VSGRPVTPKTISATAAKGRLTVTVDGKPLDLAALAKDAAPPRGNTLWLRARRTILLLESFGTPEARAVLETLASGEAEAKPTQEAKAALERRTQGK